MWGCSSPPCDLEELRIGSQDACWAPTLFLWDQFSHLGPLGFNFEGWGESRSE